IAIVTLPFSFEGEERMNNAAKGLEELEKHVDTLIVVPNDRIAELSNANTSLLDAFKHGDEVLHNGVRAISELITVPGLINLDFSDVRTVMQARGRALMGIGIADGENRAMRAAEEAVVCPLLEQSNINGAKGVIVNVRGGTDVRMHEVQQANEYIKNNVSQDATIITGAVIDREERPEFQVTVIAAGFPRKDISAYLNRSKEAQAQKAAAMASAALAAKTGERKGIPPELKPAHQDKNSPNRPAAKPTQMPIPGGDDLFNLPEKKPNVSPFITTSVEEPEDMNIPAFIRARRKRQESR
ncbi:MAG TPA: cell division protein FtsZ, partial [Candidatus Hydrogenedentes bacterium]|nr:cell division protein FtsZ [Candidatus Hydrogenedentota bacterium]